MTDIGYLSLLDSARLIRTREISSTELVKGLLGRIETLDKTLNVFIAVNADDAIEEAKKCDREMATGEWRGLLHGVPYAIKDVIDVAGARTTCHSRLTLGHTANRDATVVSRLKSAGAILIGKTSLHEFAIGGPSFDLPWPPARNPWNTGVHPGGSSSGSGSALAAGLIPLALGTDTAGSVRHPASVCGVVGMKATYGAVSMEGCFPLSFSLDHVGPMTRGVADNAVALSYLVQPSIAKRMRCHPGNEEPFTNLRCGLRNMRIGIIDVFQDDPDIDADILAATHAAFDAFRAQGALLSSIKLSPLSIYTEAGRTILRSEAFAIHSGWIRDRMHEYSERSRRRLLNGALITAERYVRAQQIRAHLLSEFESAMADIDVAVCISSLNLPCAIDDEQEIERTYDRQARTPFNLVGVPAISIPIGLSKNGLPIGLQIAGKHYDEGLVYRAALGLEEALALSMRPPLESLLDEDLRTSKTLGAVQSTAPARI